MYGRAKGPLTQSFDVNTFAFGSEFVFRQIAMAKNVGHSCSVRMVSRCIMGIFFFNLRMFWRR